VAGGTPIVNLASRKHLRRSDGTLLGLRQKLPWPANKPFRILSIDGGGIKGILPASVLSQIEEKYLDRPIGNYFDLIAGTSTGGIISLGLALGLCARKILELYTNHGAEVFPPLSFDPFGLRKKMRFLSNITHYAYRADVLRGHLDNIFRDLTLGDAKTRLCVPSFDGFTEVYIFKTPHHADYKLDWRERIVTVAMATAAAPTFFPVYKDGGRFFADGGVWANNPVMLALVDTLACYEIDRRQIQILSLGCGDSAISITPTQIKFGGLWDWKDVISSAMHLQSQNAIGQAGLLIGRDHLLRLNADAPPDGPIAMDDFIRSIKILPDSATRLVEEYGPTIRERFLYDLASPFPAFYGPRCANSEVR